MVPQRQFFQPSTEALRGEMDMTRAWESNDYIDFMAAILLGVSMTALALSVLF